MKKLYWGLIIAGANIFLLLLVFSISRIFTDSSWWWLYSTLIFLAIVDITIGVILFIKWLGQLNKQEVKEIDVELAVKKAKEEKLNDNDDPDNLIIIKKKKWYVGESGSQRTPILWLFGKGSETTNRYDAIVNLNDPKLNISWLTNATEKEVMETVIRSAENPETEITEERVLGADEYGRPTTRIISKRQSVAEKKQEEAKKELEEMNAT